MGVKKKKKKTLMRVYFAGVLAARKGR
jgi:hypothetical protein